MHKTRSAQLNAKLDELATTEVLALSRPPASFPLPESHGDTQGQAASSVTALRRELAFKQQALDDALRARDEAAEKLECSEVRRTIQPEILPDLSQFFSSSLKGPVTVLEAITKS
jgi:hypothetical protein